MLIQNQKRFPNREVRHMSSIGRPLPSLQVSKRAKQPLQRHNQQNRIVKGNSTRAKTASSSSTNLIQQPSLLGQILERYSPSPMQQQQEPPQPDTIHQPMRLDNNTSELTGSLPNRMVHTSHMLYLSPPSTPSSPFLSFPPLAPPSPYLPFYFTLDFLCLLLYFCTSSCVLQLSPIPFVYYGIIGRLSGLLSKTIYLQMTNIEFAEHCINMDRQQAFGGSSIAQADTGAEITTGITFETLDSATESQSSSGIVDTAASFNIIISYPYITSIIPLPV